MIQCDFKQCWRSKTIGSFRGHLCLVIKTLHAAKSDLSFGTKPVEQESLVRAKHLGNLLHRLELGTYGSCTPLIKKLACPGWGLVLPETLKIFLEKVRLDRLEVAFEQIHKLVHRLSVRFSGRFNRHHRLPVSNGFFPLALRALVSAALTSSMALLMLLMI